MRNIFLSILLLFSCSLQAQGLYDTDSLRALLTKANDDDTATVSLLVKLSDNYVVSQVDSSIKYAQRAIRLAQQLNDKKGEAAGMLTYAWALWASANYDKAVEMALKCLNRCKGLHDPAMMGRSYLQLIVLYRDVGDYQQALRYGFLAEKLSGDSLNTYTFIGSVYLGLDKLDSASIYINKAFDVERKAGNYRWAYVENLFGDVEGKKKRYEDALYYYRRGIPIGIAGHNYLDVVAIYNSIAKLYLETAQVDSSIYYAKEALYKWNFVVFRRAVLDAATILARAYKLKNQNDSAIKYLELSIALNDSLFNRGKTTAIQNLTFNEQQEQREIELANEKLKTRLRIYALIAGLGALLVITLILFRSNRERKKTNTLLQYQKQEIEIQKNKAEDTLTELRSAQKQLIQSEKMASLGELTAGIAHEIQNPLNFINNFSEVNGELIDELKGERSKVKGERNETLEDEIINDIKQNLEKINHHGRRADAIVKGMLQHSRSSGGQKEPADINKLADEYLRLAYQGFRAKDKSFNATLRTDFDQGIRTVNIIPQEIGRVILNLINNAFYAVHQKQQQNLEGYEPTVTVSTTRTNGVVALTVKDNGNGIPERVRDKIFQPFFTTKPTGQGTGLGLSLAYDIITKGHGGELKVETKEGEGSTFILQLPTS